MNPLNRLSRAAVFAAGLVTLAWIARADPVTDWNAHALDAIRADRTPPPLAARNLAMLHVAIFDACNGIGQNCEPYFVTAKPAGIASKEAAIAAAANRVLVNVFPAQQAAFEQYYAAGIAGIADGPAKSSGLAWGEQVAAAILQWRADDGASRIVPYAPGSGAGVWIPTPPAFAPALLPNWAQVRPFAMTGPAQFRPPPPPALSSAQWAADFNRTKDYGRSDSAVRTADETAIARFWADGAGTATPPGHWNIIARDVARQRGNTLEENARLFALLNIAEADAGIIAWDCKYAFSFWRPVTAILNADRDGNPATQSETGWTPLLITPPFPEYISGHSTFSGAAAAVLAAFYGTDDIAFITASEDPAAEARWFGSFTAAAMEAGMSRIYGGIHFMSANLMGLECGVAAGSYVADNLLLPRPGRSHRGH